jgi:hypothetical protein
MCESCSEAVEAAGTSGGPSPTASRRLFLLAGLGFLVGCAKQSAVGPLPDPPWPTYEEPPPAELPPKPDAPPAPAVRPPAGVLSRASWAHGEPVSSRMDRMTPIRYITVHHDGMDPFFASDRVVVAAHLELIRQLHRRKGWGDIGYHFAVDRAGRVWEARPLVYQGAHVKDRNPGNIGVVVLGNFEQQAPSGAQLAAMRKHLTALMGTYGVPVSRVHTHQEWDGAATVCPGGRLQHHLERLRRSGQLG